MMDGSREMKKGAGNTDVDDSPSTSLVNVSSSAGIKTTTTKKKKQQLLDDEHAAEAQPEEGPIELTTGSINKKAKLMNICTELSDEIFVEILVQFLPDARVLAKVSGVNHRFHSLLVKDERVLQRVVQKHLAANNHTTSLDILLISGRWTWKDLGFYQAAVEANLLQENRIGFDFASMDIDRDDGEASKIKGSSRRILQTAKLLWKFQDATVTIEAHCGTVAPPHSAPRFSMARAHVVSHAIGMVYFFDAGMRDDDRMILHPWGRRVAQRAAASTHPNGALARQGRSWVELYVTVGDITFPQRPAYYDGLEVDGEEELQVYGGEEGGASDEEE